jgi:hypothetical protein
MHNGFPHTSLALSHFTNEIMTKKRHLRPLKPHSRALYPQKNLAGRHIGKCLDTLAKCRDTMKVSGHFQSVGYVAKFSGESFVQGKMSATYPTSDISEIYSTVLCRGRVAPCHGCRSFLAHSMPCILRFIAFDLLLLCFKGRVEGHCPGLVTRGDNVIHKHFTELRRLARDEPLSLGHATKSHYPGLVTI